jgi:hypothetical protein
MTSDLSGDVNIVLHGFYEGRKKISRTDAEYKKLVLNLVVMMETVRGFRRAEQSAHDRMDFETDHLERVHSAVMNAGRALSEVAPDTHADFGLDMSTMLRNGELQRWKSDLERIAVGVNARIQAIALPGGAPVKRSPKHAAIGVMGVLKRGGIPFHNLTSLTSKLLEHCLGLPKKEANTGARKAREWMKENSEKTNKD